LEGLEIKILSLGMFYKCLIYFVFIWYNFMALVYCTKTNLATLHDSPTFGRKLFWWRVATIFLIPVSINQVVFTCKPKLGRREETARETTNGQNYKTCQNVLPCDKNTGSQENNFFKISWLSSTYNLQKVAQKFELLLSFSKSYLL
jgi:hypothetical protein